MSDSKKAKPLPDDFAATTPNIKIPKDALPDFEEKPSNDWEKTNYNYSPKDIGREDWNKTTYNIPKSSPPAKDADWGMTEVRINLPTNQPNSEAFDDDVFGGPQESYGKTSVGVNLPRNDPPPKYQEPPSATTERTVEGKKGGIPGWVWASAGLLTMFLFSVIVLLLVYFIFLGKTGFEVVINGGPARKEAAVDGSRWGVSTSDGAIRLPLLQAGSSKKIEIFSPGWSCQPIEISVGEAQNGAVVEKPAVCTKTSSPQQPTAQLPPANCQPKFPGDYDTSRGCADVELTKLENDDKNGKTFTVAQLLHAMNLYIIRFEKNKYEIKDPKDISFISRAAVLMKKLPPTTIIEVGGHTDSDGNNNQKLSENRATSVRNQLVNNGVNPAMLQTKGYAATQPVMPNDTEANKFMNRRIAYTAR